MNYHLQCSTAQIKQQQRSSNTKATAQQYHPVAAMLQDAAPSVCQAKRRIGIAAEQIVIKPSHQICRNLTGNTSAAIVWQRTDRTIAYQPRKICEYQPEQPRKFLEGELCESDNFNPGYDLKQIKIYIFIFQTRFQTRQMSVVQFTLLI